MILHTIQCARLDRRAFLAAAAGSGVFSAGIRGSTVPVKVRQVAKSGALGKVNLGGT